jgi:hypothetical protein
VKDWENETVIEFLNNFQMKEYVASFKENDITGENLLKMTEDDLRELGIKRIGDIVKFRNGIQKLEKFNQDHADRKNVKRRIQPVNPQNNEQVLPNGFDWIDQPEGNGKNPRREQSDKSSDEAEENKNASRLKTMKSKSSSKSNKKGFGSIEVQKVDPVRRSADLNFERKISDDQKTSTKEPTLKRNSSMFTLTASMIKPPPVRCKQRSKSLQPGECLPDAPGLTRNYSKIRPIKSNSSDSKY